MKKIASFLFLLALIFTSCSDDDVDFDTIGETYELTNINFTPANNFAIGFTFPNPIFDSDGILVYRLENVFDGLDVWEPLPTSNYFIENTGGELFYRFNYTRNDVDILIESPNLGLITDDFTLNQVFRIIVVPSAFAENPDFDISNIDTVLSRLNVTPDEIKTIKM